MTPSSTVVPFAPGPASNGLFTRSNHDDYRRLLQQGLNLVQQCLQRQQQPFSGILPQELAADFERVDLERPLGDAGAALRELDQLYLRDAVYFHHPRYVAHLNCPVVLPALLAGCSLLGGGSREPVTTWSPVVETRSDPAWPAVDWQLTIVPTTAPRVVDSPRISVRRTPSELQVYAGSVWAQPATELVELALLRTFEASDRIPAVATSGAGIASGST